MSVIDMRAMRYINLLDKVSHVRTRKCFIHNNTVFFAVRGEQVSKAIGPAASNIRKIQESVGLKIRIIRDAESVAEAKRFIEDVVSPVRIKSLEVKDNSIIITAGNNQSKAALIGRNKRRYEELERVIKDFFNLDLKII
jgi:transcription antitermination factor NusA-like protein